MIAHLPLLALLAFVGPPPQSGGPGGPGGPGPGGPRRPGEELMKMVDAYIVSNLQESLGLSDEQFVKVLPLVKRLQGERRATMIGRVRGVHRLRSLLESGTASEAQVTEQLHLLQREEQEGPEKVRKTVEAIDAALLPLQQAKFRVLESDVERRIRGIIGQARRPDGRQGGRPGGRPTPDEP